MLHDAASMLAVMTDGVRFCVVQELLAIQQSDGPKNIGFFGTRNMGVTHQKLVEILSYAYASTVGLKSRACLIHAQHGADMVCHMRRCMMYMHIAYGMRVKQAATCSGSSKPCTPTNACRGTTSSHRVQSGQTLQSSRVHFAPIHQTSSL